MRRLKSSPKFGIDFSIDPLWCAWFSGIVDGEACLHIRLKPNARAELKITLRDDEYETTGELRKTLRCGFVGSMSNKSTRVSHPNARDGTMFRVLAINEICNIIIPILDKYPLHTRKMSRYLLWRNAAMMIHEGIHLEPGGRETLRKLKLKISAGGKTESLNNTEDNHG